MLKIFVLVALLGVCSARPGGYGLDLGYGGHGSAVAVAPVAHTVVAPVAVSAGVSHVSRVDYPSPATAVVATGPAFAVGHGLGPAVAVSHGYNGLGLGYGFDGYGFAGHGLLDGHGHY